MASNAHQQFANGIQPYALQQFVFELMLSSNLKIAL
jgi:hypothetical protein